MGDEDEDDLAAMGFAPNPDEGSAPSSAALYASTEPEEAPQPDSPKPEVEEPPKAASEPPAAAPPAEPPITKPPPEPEQSSAAAPAPAAPAAEPRSTTPAPADVAESSSEMVVVDVDPSPGAVKFMDTFSGVGNQLSTLESSVRATLAPPTAHEHPHAHTYRRSYA